MTSNVAFMPATRHSSPRRALLRRTSVAALCAAAGLTLSACGDSAPKVVPKRPITQAEAEKIATMRVKIFKAGGVHFHTTLQSVDTPLLIDGDVDYKQGLGFAEASTAAESITMLWSAKGLQVWSDKVGAVTTPAKIPTGDAKGRALTPTGSSTDAVLSTMLKLAQPKNDSVTEIQTNGALWLRTDKVGETPVDVFKGPAAAGVAAPVYWLDADGNLLRLEIGFSSDVLTSIDVSTAAFKKLPS